MEPENPFSKNLLERPNFKAEQRGIWNVGNPAMQNLPGRGGRAQFSSQTGHTHSQTEVRFMVSDDLVRSSLFLHRDAANLDTACPLLSAWERASLRVTELKFRHCVWSEKDASFLMELLDTETEQSKCIYRGIRAIGYSKARLEWFMRHAAWYYTWMVHTILVHKNVNA